MTHKRREARERSAVRRQRASSPFICQGALDARSLTITCTRGSLRGVRRTATTTDCYAMAPTVRCFIDCGSREDLAVASEVERFLSRSEAEPNASRWMVAVAALSATTVSGRRESEVFVSDAA